MAKRKQNLILFLHKDIGQKEVNTKLVHTCMNRFIIDEDAQFEVNGVYHVDKDHFKEATEQSDRAKGKWFLSYAPKFTLNYDVRQKSILGELFQNQLVDALNQAKIFEDDCTQTHIIFGLSLSEIMNFSLKAAMQFLDGYLFLHGAVFREEIFDKDDL